jgi:serine protease inhibitor
MLRFHMIAGEERESGSVEFSASGISQALAIAYKLADGCTFELWQDKRKICTIHAGANVVSIGRRRGS